MAKIMLVAMIRTVSTVRLKWNVWMETVIVVEVAKTRGFSESSMPTFR